MHSPLPPLRKDMNLKRHLREWRRKGYEVVALEQTAKSTTLQKFSFAEKTLLLLGKEREGVPAVLLGEVDRCVEIPQAGLVRSLNVHVATACCVWEWARG